MTDETPVIAGMPVDQSEMVALGVPTIRPYPGSIQMHCQICQRLVWVGPEQQKARAANESVPVLCYLCLTTLANGEEVELRPLSNKQTQIDWPFRRN